MHLFQCLDAQTDKISGPTVIHTSLGRVLLTAMADELKITDETATQTYRLPCGGYIVCWHQQEFTAELLVCRPKPSLAYHEKLTDCWAGLWRLRVYHPISSCLFTAVWEDGYSWQEGWPSSGERLTTIAYNDGHSEVSIGTEDEDGLGDTANYGRDLPPEWEPYFHFAGGFPRLGWNAIPFLQHKIHEELGNKGLAIPLPALIAGQQCQVHFAVASSPYEEGPDSGLATWYAVDISDTEILAAANCV